MVPTSFPFRHSAASGSRGSAPSYTRPSGLLWLPYLPWDIPAAFLIWQGPIETAVWLAIVVGLFARSPIAWWPTLDHAARDPRKAPWLAGAVVALCALAGFTALRGVIPNGDEPHYLAVTQSILLDGDLRIENNHARGDYLSYFGGRLRPDYLQRGDEHDAGHDLVTPCAERASRELPRRGGPDRRRVADVRSRHRRLPELPAT